MADEPTPAEGLEPPVVPEPVQVAPEPAQPAAPVPSPSDIDARVGAQLRAFEERQARLLEDQFARLRQSQRDTIDARVERAMLERGDAMQRLVQRGTITPEQAAVESQQMRDELRRLEYQREQYAQAQPAPASHPSVQAYQQAQAEWEETVAEALVDNELTRSDPEFRQMYAEIGETTGRLSVAKAIRLLERKAAQYGAAKKARLSGKSAPPPPPAKKQTTVDLGGGAGVVSDDPDELANEMKTIMGRMGRADPAERKALKKKLDGLDAQLERLTR